MLDCFLNIGRFCATFVYRIGQSNYGPTRVTQHDLRSYAPYHSKNRNNDVVIKDDFRGFDFDALEGGQNAVVDLKREGAETGGIYFLFGTFLPGSTQRPSAHDPPLKYFPPALRKWFAAFTANLELWENPSTATFCVPTYI